MPQTRETGDRARKWGYFMAQRVAEHLGATLTSPMRSNEAIWGKRRILIKSANRGVPQIGATPVTLDRVEAIVAALREADDTFSLIEVTPSWFRSKMSPSRSPQASHVMMVKCANVRNEGILLGSMKEP